MWVSLLHSLGMLSLNLLVSIVGNSFSPFLSVGRSCFSLPSQTPLDGAMGSYALAMLGDHVMRSDVSLGLAASEMAQHIRHAVDGTVDPTILHRHVRVRWRKSLCCDVWVCG